MYGVEPPAHYKKQQQVEVLSSQEPVLSSQEGGGEEAVEAAVEKDVSGDVPGVEAFPPVVATYLEKRIMRATYVDGRSYDLPMVPGPDDFVICTLPCGKVVTSQLPNILLEVTFD